MRVVIAEDLALLRDGLTRLLESNDCTVVAAVDNGADLIAAVEEHEPDVSVVDVRLPPTFRDEGVRAALEARRRVPGTPVLVLSQYVERTYASELLSDGAGGVGYLLKDRVADPAEFVDAARRVAARRDGARPRGRVPAPGRARRGQPPVELTPREREVLELMAEGRTNAAIGEAMVISASAVEKHISNVFWKLDLPASDADHRRVLAVLAYLNG